MFALFVVGGCSAALRVLQVIDSEFGRRTDDDTGLWTRHSTHARRSLRSSTNGASRLRYAGWNSEPNQEWGGDYDARSESAQSRARERHSCDLLSTHVVAEGVDGRVPNENGHGVAARRNGRRGQTMVHSRYAWFSADF